MTHTDGLAAEGWHVSANMCELALVSELYEELEESGGWIMEARLVRQVPLDVDELAIRQSIEDRLLPLDGVDPRVTAFARREGSAGYLRLLLEVPQRLRIE